MRENLLPRLASQIKQARVILFTGAGFSLDAQSRSGEKLPSAAQLTSELWSLAFPNESHDGSGLQDTYEAALSQAARATADLLRERLTVDPATLAADYELWFSMPWYRVYTLNIDDLVVGPVSCLSHPASTLPVYVHLNCRAVRL